VADTAIAIVGMACRYPDARSPRELWENVLAQRRAFRRIPPDRLRVEDYAAAGPDSISTVTAAVLEGFEFDRVRFRTAGDTYRQADLAHWLALEVASEALADAGFPDAAGLPREATGVLVGNTLTGEFSRARMMRLRWPYVRRTTDAALAGAGWPSERRAEFLAELERRYKAPFEAFGEEALAGGLSNTIAGRICNFFDLNGGGYTVDGACASSLLAVCNACSALAAGDLDFALAGGVDLSLDPFELVGFSRVGVLATEPMRVYDAKPTGFWPGEGCGFVVLARRADAEARGLAIHALIRGWGVASDGGGGTTRPEAEGQMLALARAYRRAGFGAETVGYFEGHGTGTPVGDPVEIEAIRGARGAGAAPAALGSIKANIGHTKAAAGVAGLIRATMALRSQVLPPLAGHREPHPALAAAGLRVPRTGEPWPESVALRAGVSAMGFGGIDTHVVLESAATTRKPGLDDDERRLVATPQDAELLLFSARDAAGLREAIARVRAVAAGLSYGEIADLAGMLARSAGEGTLRAACVAASPAELEQGLARLDAWLEDGVRARLDVDSGLALGSAERAPRVGLLFTGQGSPSHADGGLWARRFPATRPLYDRVALPPGADPVATDVAQPAIVANSLAALRVFEAIGLGAACGVGHSLGELTALCWAGAFDEAGVLRVAAARGRAMADLGAAGGAMASLAAGGDAVAPWVDGRRVVVAGLNGPRRTVISGEAAAVAAVVERARAAGIAATPLAVSHAFHSPLVAAAAPALRAALEGEAIAPLRRAVASTVTGARLDPGDDLRPLLARQVTSPVRFAEAVAACGEVDLWIEAGPGRTLAHLVSDLSRAPAVAVDAGGESVAGLLLAAGAAWALGAPLRMEALFADRFSRPFDLARAPRFLANPCERAPLPSADSAPAGEQAAAEAPAEAPEAPADTAADPLELVRGLVARRVELPVSSVAPGDRLLADLHLNSIVVAQVAVEAARGLGLAPPTDPTRFAGATVGELAEALAELRAGAAGAPEAESTGPPDGIGPWTRVFLVRPVERPKPALPRAAGAPQWEVLADEGHPLARVLAEAFARDGAGSGVAVCLSSPPAEADVVRLLDGARAAMTARGTRFVVVHDGGGGSAFARTLHQESPATPVTVVDVPFDHPDAAAWVVAEASSGGGFAEAGFDRAGRRFEPAWLALATPARAEADTAGADPAPLGPGDVLLVSGGGKGIAAECALDLARRHGVRLALLGRSRPEADAALASHLARLAAAGIEHRYLAADVTDAAGVRAAVAAFEHDLGPVTAVLHAAAVNVPRPLSALSGPDVLGTLAPKLTGLRNVLAAVDAGALRLLVAFGSIIGRTGLRGEAHYGLANEWLGMFVERFQADHPRCRCLVADWSVWSGVGMGERLGRTEALARAGTSPIPPDVGMRVLSALLRADPPATRLVIAGRFGPARHVEFAGADLPLRRFLERIALHYPGVELIAEAALTVESDPYVSDHVYEGVPLFPAVMGLEAMAQVAQGATRGAALPAFEDVRFARPVTADPSAPRTLRIAALADSGGPDGAVDVAVRSAETAFRVDHFRARCVFGGPATPPAAAPDGGVEGLLPLDPGRDLYDRILFQRGRFRRVAGYRWLRATECRFEVCGDPAATWFGGYLPGELVLGDPGVRDAAIHGIQVCVPHATLLPVAVGRIEPARLDGEGPWRVHARERERDGDRYVYDLEIAGPGGDVVERWRGLELRAVAPAGTRAPGGNGAAWPVPLLGAYLERRIHDLVPGAAVRVAVVTAPGGPRPAAGDRAIRTALGDGSAAVLRDSRGRPHLAGGGDAGVSAAHADGVVLGVAGPRAVGCDAEVVAPRTEGEWRDLLGAGRFELASLLARETGEDAPAAATRVWSALESLKKAGYPDAPLALESALPDGWVVLSSGRLRVATYVAALDRPARRVAVAVFPGGADDRV
jgi:enediyne polyketide synthase